MSEAVDGSEGSWIAGTIKRALEGGLADYAVEVYEEHAAQAGDDVLATLKAVPDLRGPGAQMFLAARDFGRAARLYEAQNLWPKAAAQFEEAGELGEAARCWQKGGDAARAAQLYDSAGQHQAAVPLYQKLGDHAAAARCLLQSGRSLDAARLYQKLGNVRGEVDALKAVKGDDPEHPAAIKRLAELYATRKRLAEAAQFIEGGLRDGAAARADRELHEMLIGLYEGLGKPEHAERARQRLAGKAVSPPPPDLAATQVVQTKDGYGFLKAIPLFARLSIDDMKDLYRLMTEVSFGLGDVILDQGVDGRGLFVVLEGKVDILLSTATGIKRLNTLGAGAYFGEVSLLGKSKTSARVAAVAEKVDALHIEPAKFEHFLQGRPGAALRVYRLFAENLAERVRALSSR